MGQGATDASDAGSARGRVQDEDQTVILPRVDAAKGRPEASKARPDAGKPRPDAAKAGADVKAAADAKAGADASQARTDPGKAPAGARQARADVPQARADVPQARAAEDPARADQAVAQELLAQEMLAQDLLADVPWPDDNAAYAGERPPGELASSLVSGLATFPYLGRTIRRRARLWCIFGVVGLVLGLGLHYVKPPPAKASTEVQLTYPPASNPIDAINTEVALVMSRSVAGLAEHQLGLTENVTKFLASYTATDPTDRIIVITASAPTAAEATSRANALAKVFLQFQASQLTAQEQAVVKQILQQEGALYTKINAENAAIASAKATGASASQRASLIRLQGDRSQDQGTVSGLQQALQDYQLNNEVGNATVNAGSTVLYPAAVLPPSKVKSSAAYAIGGLVAGLLIGIVIVIIGALVSDKLRRRDDIARALSAPVELSVGRVRARRQARRRDLAALRDRHLQRVVAYLDRIIPGRSSRRAPALVVIPLDAQPTGALAVAALAFARARRDQKVVVADLLDGAPAARLLGVRETGTHAVDVAGQKLTVVVPEGLGPVGPLAKPGAQEPAAQAGPQVDVAAAYSNADLLITLAAADPTLSADYLRSWGTGSIVLVTAGTSSASKLHATAEMIRLAGLPILSAVVLGADKSDDSSGAWSPAGPVADGEFQENGQVSTVDAFLSALAHGDRK
jgi:capsular polysaccharide biosynthesis protein